MVKSDLLQGLVALGVLLVLLFFWLYTLCCRKRQSSDSDVESETTSDGDSIFIVSDANATGAIIRTELNNNGESPEDESNNYIVTLDNHEYLVSNVLPNGKTVLVPVRSVTPPPSYKSLFGED